MDGYYIDAKESSFYLVFRQEMGFGELVAQHAKIYSIYV